MYCMQLDQRGVISGLDKVYAEPVPIAQVCHLMARLAEQGADEAASHIFPIVFPAGKA